MPSLGDEQEIGDGFVHEVIQVGRRGIGKPSVCERDAAEGRACWRGGGHDGTDVGEGEELPGETGRAEAPDRALRSSPDHVPEEPTSPHACSPAPTGPTIFTVPFNNTVWHLIDS